MGWPGDNRISGNAWHRGPGTGLPLALAAACGGSLGACPPRESRRWRDRLGVIYTCCPKGMECAGDPRVLLAHARKAPALSVRFSPESSDHNRSAHQDQVTSHGSRGKPVLGLRWSVRFGKNWYLSTINILSFSKSPYFVDTCLEKGNENELASQSGQCLKATDSRCQ